MKTWSQLNKYTKTSKSNTLILIYVWLYLLHFCQTCDFELGEGHQNCHETSVQFIHRPCEYHQACLKTHLQHEPPKTIQ